MGKRLHWVGLVLFLCSSQLLAAEADPCDPWVAKITSVQGNVEAKRADQAEWSAVSLEELFCPGDQIRVGDEARAAVILSNDTLLRLNQNSAITLSAIEQDGPSILELLKGIGHFISRVPRSLKVNTPFVNAAIEGTEFVVAVKPSQTDVTVFEGIVLTENRHGQLRITQNETAIATADSAPRKALVATPRNAVQWALYFPPVFDNAQGNIARAQDRLYTGQVKAAREILNGDTGADALSLQAIIAVVENDPDTAMKFASAAVTEAPQLAAARIALSYAQQAKRDLNAALTSAQQATRDEADSALAWARLAELQLSSGDLEHALTSATKATQLNPKLSRTQTILGFAYLLQIKIDKATATFAKAIELDQVDPLPRLGLGLAKIRDNHLTEGRREMEIAASLDPNNAVIRSYLGKAYFEENRNKLAAEQFAMAKQLDPNDPTPWFYDAILKQTQNNPVGALEDLNKSIALNDNRAVYRSSLQLDQDEAARSVSLAAIYQSLDFDQLALLEAWSSVNNNPGNASAHRFLSEAYKNQPRHEIARVSEALQSKLLQDVNLTSNLASQNDAKVTILESNLSTKLGLNEYDSLFLRDDMTFTANAFGGSNDTISEELGFHGVTGPLSYSASQFFYSSDGYRQNNDLKYNIYNAFLQYNPSYKHNIQFEATSRNVEYGDIAQRIDPSDIRNENRRRIKTDVFRLGYKYDLDSRSKLITSLLYNNERDITHRSSTSSGGVLTVTDSTLNSDGVLGEIQYLFTGNSSNLTFGVGHFSDNQNIITDLASSFGGVPLPPPFSGTIEIRENTHHSNSYAYYSYSFSHNSTILIGGSYDDHNGRLVEKENFNPKFGVSYAPNSNLLLRGAYYEVVRRSLFREQTIEPTQIVGFNQFFDETSATLSENTGLGISFKTDSFTMGSEAILRDLTVPRALLNEDTREEKNYRFYIYWQPVNKVSLSVEYISDFFKSDLVPPTTTEVAWMKTKTLPLSITYKPTKKINATLTGTYVEQEVDIDGTMFNTDFSLLDLALGYSFSKHSNLELVIKNLTDKQFTYQDKNFLLNEDHAPTFIPETSIYLYVKFIL